MVYFERLLLGLAETDDRRIKSAVQRARAVGHWRADAHRPRGRFRRGIPVLVVAHVKRVQHRRHGSFHDAWLVGRIGGGEQRG